MRVFALVAVLFVNACATNPAPAVAGPPQGPDLTASVQMVTHGQYKVCTGFSVNEAEGYWLTANHCWQEGALIGISGVPAQIVEYDEEGDFLLLRSTIHAKALLPGSTPKVGDPVELVGFPTRFVQPITLFGHVSRLSTWIQSNSDVVGDVMLTTACGARGLSGGPVLARARRSKDPGRVIGMVVGGFETPCLDMSVRVEKIRKFLGLRWES